MVRLGAGLSLAFASATPVTYSQGGSGGTAPPPGSPGGAAVGYGGGGGGGGAQVNNAFPGSQGIVIIAYPS